MDTRLVFGLGALAAAALVKWRSTRAPELRKQAAEEAATRAKMEMKWDLLSRVHGYWATQMCYVLCKLEIPDLLAKKPLTIDELAAATGAHTLNLTRFLRITIAVGLLDYDWDSGKYSLQARGEMLCEGPQSMKYMSLLNGGPNRYRTLSRLIDSVLHGTPQFEAENGLPFYEHLAAAPAEQQDIFNKAMIEYGADENLTGTDPIAKTIDFSGDAVICDVGGGTGKFLQNCLDVAPHAEGVLFDLERVNAKHAWGDDESVTRRTSLVNGSFFEKLPCCDTYMLKNVIHDWENTKATQLLRAIRNGMAAEATDKFHGVAARRAPKDRRLLVLAKAVPEDNYMDSLKWTDLTFMAVLGGQERTMTEFKSLFAAAGLQLVKATETNGRGSRLVIEARLA